MVAGRTSRAKIMSFGDCNSSSRALVHWLIPHLNLDRTTESDRSFGGVSLSPLFLFFIFLHDFPSLLMISFCKRSRTMSFISEEHTWFVPR